MLSSGPEPGGPSRSRRRWTTPLAGLLVAAAAAYLAGHAGGGAGTDRPSAAEPSLDVRVRPAPNPARTGPPPPIARYRLGGYAWPSAYRAKPTEADWKALLAVYSRAEVNRFRRSGIGYYGYRAGIARSGDWQFFVAGD